MKEVKEKKKPILFYYIVALAVIFMFNAIARPYYDSKSVKQVDYGTFMNMTEDEKIADVQIEENQILFKDKDGNEYRTGVVNDPQLTERLHKANVSFNEVIKEKDSPFTDFLIAWILPILIFFGVGYYFNRKLMNRGGGNSLMFGAKNQVKVYVPSANGIHFDDVAGEDEAKENLSEIVDFLQVNISTMVHPSFMTSSMH
uniref:ATP-dependent metallopeptidase FtsH/Yme1/Tma family protein n=1 Tax=Megasphaera sp. TaxID=2023260 RepID=UPI003078E76C